LVGTKFRMGCFLRYRPGLWTHHAKIMHAWEWLVSYGTLSWLPVSYDGFPSAELASYV